VSTTPEDYTAGRIELLTGRNESDRTRAGFYRQAMAEVSPLPPLVMLDPQGSAVYGRTFLSFVTITGEASNALVLTLTEPEADLVATALAAADLAEMHLDAVALLDGEVMAGAVMLDGAPGPVLVVILDPLDPAITGEVA
jgi:hypothetical protein